MAGRLCLAEPRPLGVLVSRRRCGACVVLRWSDRDQRHWCGMAEPCKRHRLAPSVGGARSVAAGAALMLGVGCDADLQAQAAPPGCNNDFAIKKYVCACVSSARVPI